MHAWLIPLTRSLQLSPSLNVLFKNGAYRWLIDTEGTLIYSPVSFKFAQMKELSIFGFIGFKRMNRTCDFWAVILWMYFKRIQQWGLIMVPQVRILLFFEAWCSRKKMSPRVSISFHLKTFRSKETKIISVHYSDVVCKLENERLNRILRSVWPEKCFIR